VVTVGRLVRYRFARAHNARDGIVDSSRLQAKQLLRLVASRRRGSCELSPVAAMIALVQKDGSLPAALSLQTKLNLEANLSNVP
jgi:hypothetical protein